MIYNRMRQYNYWLVAVNDLYGQEVMPSADAEPVGTVKLSIFPTSTGTQDNILYANCAYVALTYDAEIDDKYVVAYGKERLKVMYCQPQGRMKQVFLRRVE